MSENKRTTLPPKAARKRRIKSDRDTEKEEQSLGDISAAFLEHPVKFEEESHPKEVPVTIPSVDGGAGLEVNDEIPIRPVLGSHSGEGSLTRVEVSPTVAGPGTNTKKESVEPPQGLRIRLSDEYTLQTFFDKGPKSFVATVAEFPEMKVTGISRDAVVREIENRLESHVENLRRRGEQLPEAIAARKYPEKLELRISQGLFRRLDNLSRHEKTSLDQLIVEMLAAGVEKRLEPPQRPQQDRRPQQHQGGNRQQHNQGEPGNRRHPHSQQQQHGRRGVGHGRNYQETMENRENFMEYVRNLEKGNLRKK